MPTSKTVVSVVLLGILLGIGALGDAVAGERENLDVIKRHLEEVWHNQNYAAVGDMLTQNYVRHLPGGEDVRGREAYVEYVKGVMVPSPDARFNMDLVITKGDYVVVRYRGGGTNTAQGPLGPPTGKKWNVTSIFIHRLENGKLAECWGEWDKEGYLRQLGQLPEAK
jgi:predicted ester cyclase